MLTKIQEEMGRPEGRLYIGTSNVVIPGNKSGFPAEFREKSRLHYYSQLFNSVEINATFYKTPKPGTMRRWSEETADDFRFSFKFPKTVSHAKGLAVEADELQRFVQSTQAVNDKTACYLLQFPKSIGYEYLDRVDDLLDKIRVHSGMKKARIAVEFRHPGWYHPSTSKMLTRHRVSAVLHDIPLSRLSDPAGNSSFIYIRFHGEKGDYRGCYPPEVLRAWHARVSGWLLTGRDVYVYFNNTIGDAYRNAIDFSRMFPQHSR